VTFAGRSQRLLRGIMKFIPTEQIELAVKPVAEEMGVEIVEIEAKVSKNPSLTFFIETESGIDLDTLEAFHRRIDTILDEKDVSCGSAYTLNVSSPGLDRPFKTERDYLRNLQKEVEIKLYAPLKGEKTFEGILVEYNPNFIVIERNGEQIKLTHTQIAKINQAVKFD